VDGRCVLESGGAVAALNDAKAIDLLMGAGAEERLVPDLDEILEIGSNWATSGPK
jgi:hypothetical protein